MATHYTIEGNALLIEQELVVVMQDYVMRHQSAPARGEWGEWVAEHLYDLVITEHEVTEAVALGDSGLIYTPLYELDASEDGNIKDILERAYRREVEAKVNAWAEDLWGEVSEAETWHSPYGCDDCRTEAEEPEECPECGRVMDKAGLETAVDFDAVLAEDLERYSID